MLFATVVGSGIMAERLAGGNVAVALVQLICGIGGVWSAHLMFGTPILALSAHPRTGIGQWISEAIATFGLILTILGTMRHRPAWVAPSVALYIIAAYWFTASTSFANPAITVARSLSDSFAGIAVADVPMFVLAQFVGALAGMKTAHLLFPIENTDEAVLVR